MRADIYIEGVLRKCDALKRSGLWAVEPDLRPRAWLDNFNQPDERLLAAILLDNLIYYSSRVCDRLLIGAYHKLEDDLLNGTIACGEDPVEFINRLIFTPIEGEDPNPTDSGNILCRKARDVLGIEEHRIKNTFEALSEARGRAPIVFIDDFLGTGEQFVKTWERDYRAVAPHSFKDSHISVPFHSFCLVLVATEEALAHIKKNAPSVHVVATHIVDQTYSAKHLDPPLISPSIANFKAAIEQFLRKYSAALHMQAFMNKSDWRLFGFHSLGLLLAFEHGVPDSSIPLTWAHAPEPWVRLVKPR